MNKTIIWTDGSSRGNPGRGGFGAVVIENDFVKEFGGFEDQTTNNRMEIKSAIVALKNCQNNLASIYTDSSYLVSAMTSWIFSWQKNNWMKKSSDRNEEVLNKDLFLELLEVSKGKKVEWIKVSGHSGIPLNERCDVIAKSFADGKPEPLFFGKVSDYKISLDFDLNKNDSPVKEKKSNQKAYSYVSKIDGQIFIDKNWEDCKKRVFRVSNVKYKKSLSKDDEEKIVEYFKSI